MKNRKPVFVDRVKCVLWAILTGNESLPQCYESIGGFKGKSPARNGNKNRGCGHQQFGKWNLK